MKRVNKIQNLTQICQQQQKAIDLLQMPAHKDSNLCTLSVN